LETASSGAASLVAVNATSSDKIESEDGQSLVETYLSRRPDLVRFFTQRLRSAAAAEDLVQDIYVRLAAQDGAVAIHNPVGYLYRLGSNLMLDRLRGERRAAIRESAWLDSHSTRIGLEQVAEDSGAEHAMVAKQRLETVIAALRELPEQTQRVFRMHKFDGMSHPEVAQALGISRSAVEKHVMAALKLLSARLR
jgi:RNA polymerase sigma factor (sigma-70 family)